MSHIYTVAVVAQECVSQLYSDHPHSTRHDPRPPPVHGTTLLAPNTLTRSFLNITLGILIQSIEHKCSMYQWDAMFGCGTTLKICSVVDMY